MSDLIKNRITETGRHAIQGLIEDVEDELKQAVEKEGEDSAAGKRVLILASLYQVLGDYAAAEPLIRAQVIRSEEEYGPHSHELAWSLILLSHNCIGMGQREESLSVLEKLKTCVESLSLKRSPLLEGLHDLASAYRQKMSPMDERRGFLLLLMTLGWFARYPSDWDTYEELHMDLQEVFESYGFAGDLWEWLVVYCNPNLHDLLGLISVLLEKHIVPLDAVGPLPVRTQHEALESLAQEFPIDGETEHLGCALSGDGETWVLRFVCPRCGSRDLRTMMFVAHYPVSTLEGLEVDSETLEFEELHEREDPFEWRPTNHNDGWEFWCDKCGLVPNLDEYDDAETQEDKLVKWLLANCPQSPIVHAVTKSNKTQD